MHSSRKEAEKNQNSVQGYLDGVPVKIGEQFRPPRRVVLPVNFIQRNPSEALSEDYNFSVERQVVEWAEKQRNAKEAKAKAHVENVAHQIEQFTRLNHGPNEGNGLESSSSAHTPAADEGGDAGGTTEAVTNEAGTSNINSALLANFGTRDILQPMPLKNPAGAGSHPKNQHVESRPANNIKLEDFEAESSPFDSVELKTLNDMEELKSVLQGMTPSPRVEDGSAPATQFVESKSDGKPLLNGTIQYYPGGGSHINGVLPMSVSSSYPPPSSYADLQPSQQRRTPKQFSDFSSYLPDNSQFQLSSTNLPTTYANSGPNYTTYLSTSTSTTNAPWMVDKSTVPMPTYYPMLDTDNLSSQPSMSTEPSHSSLYYSMETNRNQLHTPSSESSGSSTGSLRNAQSTPDLLKDVRTKEEVNERKRQSHSHPPRPNSVGSVEEAAANAFHQEKFKHQTPRDLFKELSEEERKVVLQMVDMGFPRARAERAVRSLGTDDKRIVEYLCAVQSLTEKGFDSDRVEYALSVHNHDESVAHTYLQLTKQFLDLGFDEEAIRKALALHKNDRDKALDYLVS